MLKLYDYTQAPSPRRARMVLAEKGLEYESIQIDLRAGEQLKPDFQAINPRCTVPALITEGGSIICENSGIAAYLEAICPTPPLLGTTALEKAQIAEWNSLCEFGGLMPVAEALRNSTPQMKDRALPGPRNLAQIPELAKRGQTRIKWFFETLNKRLSDNSYVAGQNYSVADITATVFVDFARWVKAEPDPSQTALLAWHEKMQSRGNYKA